LTEAKVQTPKRPLLAVIFLSPNEPRLRAGWRLLAQTFAMFIIAIPFSLLVVISMLAMEAQWQLLVSEVVEEHLWLVVHVVHDHVQIPVAIQVADDRRA